MKKVFVALIFTLLSTVMKAEINLSDDILKDIDTRYPDAMVTDSYPYGEDKIKIKITFIDRSGVNRIAVVTYDNEGWVMTRSRYKELETMPLELVMYINDLGGKGAIKTVALYEMPNRPRFYAIKDNEGNVIRVDCDFQKLSDALNLELTAIDN